MAGSQERVLRRRIRSVESTKKITRAFELIAASRIIRAQQAIVAARPYVAKMAQVVANLADTPEASSQPIFADAGEEASESPEKVAVILIAADRGLAGAYNSSVIRAAERAIREHERAGREVTLVTVGRKAETYFRFRKRQIDTSITGITERPGFEDARRVVAAISEQLATGEIGQVQLVYTQFLTMSSQAVALRQLVPIDREAVAAGAEQAEPAEDAADREPGERHGAHKTVYEFEPEPDEILERLLPRWLEAEVLAAMLEAAASQQAARQRAMKAATENADELIKVFRRDMNRARQESITTEIMEIVGGSEALRQGGADDQSGLYHEFFEPAAESA
ncbi:MAG: ATP synthase F1 subunit gamma [Acidimicrobiales bacterium]